MRPGVLLARRTRTMKKMGRAPTLVLCSRNARPEKEMRGRARWSPVLVQRAVSEDPRWARAVGDHLSCAVIATAWHKWRSCRSDVLYAN